MRKYKVLIEDAFALDNPAGIGYYTNGLYKSFEKNSDFLLCKIPEKKILHRIPNKFFKKIAYIFWLNTFFLLWLSVKKIDVVHFTNYLIPFIRLKGCKYVVTIHDLWDDKNLLPKFYGAYIKFVIRHSLKRAHTVLTVSNAIREQILREFSISDDKVVTVYEGYEANIVINPVAFPQHPSGYILFVGTQSKQKNIETLLRAFSDASSTYQGNLVLIGKKGDSTEWIDNFINESQLSSRIFNMGYCSRNVVCDYMSSTSLFVFPSFYEGFGIGLLEAMSYNLRILASDIPTTKEIAGQSIHYFSPVDSYESLAREIISLTLENKDKDADTRSQRYDAILSKLNWENSADLHMREYFRNF